MTNTSPDKIEPETTWYHSKSALNERLLLLINADSLDLESIYSDLTCIHIERGNSTEEMKQNLEAFFNGEKNIWSLLRTAVINNALKLEEPCSEKIPETRDRGLDAKSLYGKWHINKQSFLIWHQTNKNKIRDILPYWAEDLCCFNENLFGKLIAVESSLVFYRNADFWEIGIKKTKLFRHKKGLAYLQFLLLHPGKDYSCRELQQIELGHESLTVRRFEKNSDHIALPPESVEENAKIMKEDMAEAQREIEDAKNNNSLDVAILEKELIEQAKLYHSLYDNKGRPRNLGDQNEKSRKSVTKALKDAKDVIVKELPYTKDILSEVKFGTRVVYMPQGQPVEILTSPLKSKTHLF